MRALDRKLLRDLWQLKGQTLAISLVIGAGVAMYVMYLSTFASLRLTQTTYYERYRLADVFASVKRAPLWLEKRIADIPGVVRVATRVVADVNLDVEGLSEPAVGRLVSIPDRRTATLNDLFLRSGRFPEPGHPDEVLVAESFALARGLGPGDAVAAVINGRRRLLEITGVALSPEYVYVIRPGEILPDDSRFGVFWMQRKGLATAFQMEGGFNDVALQLAPAASEEAVIDRLDELLRPFGGLGAIPRSRQLSHWYLENELHGLQTFGSAIPVVFLAVAGFLLNVVLSRIVSVQREQIAMLKAVGYSNAVLGWHYTKMSLLVGLAGSAVGLAGGAWLGSGLTRLYTDFFRFPILEYHLPPPVVLTATAVALLAAILGGIGAVRRAAKLPPAEAMRPEPPALYRETVVERLGLKRLLSQPVRMILRNLQRRPGRTAISIFGIACSGAMLIVGMFFLDAMDEMMDIQFNVAWRQDLTVSLVEPVSARALHEIGRLPGVHHVEPQRAVPARLSFRNRSRQLGIIGLPADAQLSRVVGASLEPVQLPPEGVVLSTKLAEMIGVRPGDVLTVEVLEGARPVRAVPVAGLVDEYIGTSAYMEIGALHRLMREAGSLSGAVLQVDPDAADDLYSRLKAIPAVAGVSLKRAAFEAFERTIGETMDVIIFFNVLFAGVIAFGVVYNAARISLSENSRELASLRVLGFTRAEISFILLGELAVLTLAAVPLGLVVGYGLAIVVVEIFDTELYRVPVVVAARTYAFSAVTVIVAAFLSGLVVRRKLDRLDLVAVLKTRE